jgi:hypothetical protein
VDRWLEFGRADMLQMLEAALGRGQVPEWLDIPELLSWHQPDLLDLLPTALPALAGGAAAATSWTLIMARIFLQCPGQ